MRAVLFAVLALGAISTVSRTHKPRAGATPVPTPTASPIPTPEPITDAEIVELVKTWPKFERAAAALDAVPVPTGSDSLAAADAATGAGERFDAALKAEGIDPERFLDLYRRAAGAWAALQEQEEAALADRAVDEQVRELKRVAGADEARARLEHARDVEAKEESRIPMDPDSIGAARRHRDALRRIFGE